MKQKKGSSFTLGVDLGGTKVEAALVDTEGIILSSYRHPTHPEKESSQIIEDIVSCVEQCLDKGKKHALALGIGVAGQVDSYGVVRSSPNLGWRNVPLASLLEDRVKLPVYVTNDVRAASCGEWRFGAGKGIDDLIVIFVGTGIGGGVVSGGHILEGCTNTAGEIGHTTLFAEGRSCHCPNRGCLEAYAGGWAIAERAQEAVQGDPVAGKCLASLAGSIEKITAATVSRAYHEGDLLAFQLVKETIQYLGSSLAGMVNAFNPCVIVMGGGVVEGLPEIVEDVGAIVKKRALRPAAEKVKVVKAALGNKAGIIGAAALAREVLREGR